MGADPRRCCDRRLNITSKSLRRQSTCRTGGRGSPGGASPGRRRRPRCSCDNGGARRRCAGEGECCQRAAAGSWVESLFHQAEADKLLGCIGDGMGGSMKDVGRTGRPSMCMRRRCSSRMTRLTSSPASSGSVTNASSAYRRRRSQMDIGPATSLSRGGSLRRPGQRRSGSRGR